MGQELVRQEFSFTKRTRVAARFSLWLLGILLAGGWMLARVLPLANGIAVDSGEELSSIGVAALSLVPFLLHPIAWPLIGLAAAGLIVLRFKAEPESKRARRGFNALLLGLAAAVLALLATLAWSVG